MTSRRPSHRYKTLIIIRGLPGTGKSALARKLIKNNSGEIFSSDDYFEGEEILSRKLHQAHTWNRSRALEAMEIGVDPVVIDNTNMAYWEMYPYVRMGFHRPYYIKFYETEIEHVDLSDLYVRCKRKISIDTLERMKDSYMPVKHIYQILFDSQSRRKWLKSHEMLQSYW